MHKIKVEKHQRKKYGALLFEIHVHMYEQQKATQKKIWEFWVKQNQNDGQKWMYTVMYTAVG